MEEPLEKLNGHHSEDDADHAESNHGHFEALVVGLLFREPDLLRHLRYPTSRLAPPLWR